jgi:hypothetical protein
MMNYDDGDYSHHHDDTPGQPETYPQDWGWDNQQQQQEQANLETSTHSHSISNPSIMDVSPNTSFSALKPPSVITRRHVPLPPRMSLINSSNDANLRQEIISVSSTHKHISNQLDSIMNKLDSFSSLAPPSSSQ